MSDETHAASVNPNAVPIAAAATLLQRAGGAVTEAMIRADLAAGAPANPDGTVNLLHYAAWHVKKAES